MMILNHLNWANDAGLISPAYACYQGKRMLYKPDSIGRLCERSEAIQIDSSLDIRSGLLHYVRKDDN